MYLKIIIQNFKHYKSVLPKNKERIYTLVVVISHEGKLPFIGVM